MASPQLEVAPARGLIDGPFSICVTGAKAGEQVALRVSTRDHASQAWASEATFIAAADGSVDVGAMAPVSGSYAITDATGPLWSMRPDDPEGGTGAFQVLSLDPLEVGVEASCRGVVVGRAAVARGLLAVGARAVDVRDEGLLAKLFLPPGNEPAPGVVVVGGSGGGLPLAQAALLSNHGFAVLALAYFGIAPLPLDLADIPLEYFETAFAWLSRQPRVRAGSLGVVGTSRGGELVLLLGASFPAVGAVVAYVPSHVVHAAVSSRPTASGASWTRYGKPVAFLRIPPAAGGAGHAGTRDDPVPLTPQFLAALADAHAVEASAIPVERIGGPVLLISGKDDQMWPSSLMADRVMERLKANGFGHSYQHFAYADAGHMIGVPGLPSTVSASLHPVAQRYFTYGGTPAGTAAARADSWQRVVGFLRTSLGG